MTPAPPNTPTPSAPAQRLAIVTRRFWPISGPTEHAVGDLAMALKRAGHTVELFTVRWGKTWPTNVTFRETPVRRVPKPSAGPWGSYRYLKSLSRHIADFQPDGIIAFGTGNETWSVTRTFAEHIPIAVRMDQRTIHERSAHASASARQAEIFALATSILTDCAETSRAILKIAPSADSKIQELPDILEAVTDGERSVAKQSAARSALCDAHPVLVTEPGQRLVVCGASLDEDGGVFDLVRAWPTVLEQFPKAKLWIIGDGRCGPDLWKEVSHSHLVYSVILPGFFDCLTEVFQAADLYVHPLRRTGHCHNLVRALLAGVGVVGTTACEHAGLVQRNVSGLVVEPENPQALAEALIHGLSDRELGERLGRAGQKQQQSQHQPASLVAQYLAPFQTTAAKRAQALN